MRNSDEINLDIKPSISLKMDVLHVEVSRNPTSHSKTADVVKLLQDAIENLENPVRDFCIHDAKNTHLKTHVHSIKFCSASSTYRTVKASGRALERGRVHGCNGYKSHSKIEYHIFKLNEEGENAEFAEDDDDEGQSPSSHHWILPSQAYHDLWDSLVFKSDIKTRLIDYIKTAMLYSEKMVNESLISWNKVILLHGPPGTGKTSLCKALAHKATIRLGSRFDYGQLIEINSHSLFSKWFSESGKLVTRMFEKVQELIEDPHSIVFLLIDEVESLAQCRSSALKGNEPSDSIRAVNALLTQIDRIKKYPNVVILTTSNIVGSIDLAFVDRADMKIFIGNPPADIIYEILASSVNELLRVGIISSENNIYLPPTQKDVEVHDPAYNAAVHLIKISKQAINMSGRTLRKIPFLTHVNFVGQEYCNLEYFLVSMERAVKAEKNELETLDSKYFLRSQKADQEGDVPEIIGVYEPGTSAPTFSSGRSRASRSQPGIGEETSTQSTPASSTTSSRHIGRPRKPIVKATTKNSSSKYSQDSPINDPVSLKSKVNKNIDELPKNSEVSNRKKIMSVKDGPCPRSKKKSLTTPTLPVSPVESSRNRSGNSISESVKSVDTVDGIRLRNTKVVHTQCDSDDSDGNYRGHSRRFDVDEPEIISHNKSHKSSRLTRKPRLGIKNCFVDLSGSICDPQKVKEILQRQNAHQSNSKTSHTNTATATAKSTTKISKPTGSHTSLEVERKAKTKVTEESLMVTSDLPEGMVAAVRPLPSPKLIGSDINNAKTSDSSVSRKNSKSPDQTIVRDEPASKLSGIVSVVPTATSVKVEPSDNISSSKKLSPHGILKVPFKPVPMPKIMPKLEEVEKDSISKIPSSTLKTAEASSHSLKPSTNSDTNTTKTVTTPLSQPTVDIAKIDPDSHLNSSTTLKLPKPESFSLNSNSTVKLSVSVTSPSPLPGSQQQAAANFNLSKTIGPGKFNSFSVKAPTTSTGTSTFNNNTQRSLQPQPRPPVSPASAAASTELQRNASQKIQKPVTSNQKTTDSVGFISNSTFRPSSTYNSPRISISTNSESASKNNNSNALARTNSDSTNGNSSGHPSSAKRPRLSISNERSPLDIIDLEDAETVIISHNNSPRSNPFPKGKLLSSGPSSVASSIASSPEPDCRFTVLSKQSFSGSLNQGAKPKKNSFVCDICDVCFKYKKELTAHKQVHAEVTSRICCNQCDKTFAKPDYLRKHMPRCKGQKLESGPSSSFNTKNQLDGTRLTIKTMSTSNGTVKNSNITLSSNRIGNGNGIHKKSYSYNQQKTVSTGKQSGLNTIPQGEEYSPASSYTSHSPASVNNNNLGSQDASLYRKSGGKLNCSDCGEIFATEKLLQRHSVVHQEERPFPCTICSKTFKTEASLKMHDRLNHKELHYACSVCGLVFDSEEEVEEHEGKDHDPNLQQNHNTNSRLMVPIPMGSVNSSSSLNAMDIFPNDPQTPYSHAATELSSSVSSILSNSSDCEQLGGFYGGGSCGTPYSETNTVESTALTVSSMDTLRNDTNPFNSHFPNGSSLDSLDFPLGDDYQNCNICGECFLGEYELTQHKQIFHNNSLPGQLPEIPSEVVGCFMNETTSSVPVPDAETIIEVETTDEFLNFLSAF